MYAWAKYARIYKNSHYVRILCANKSTHAHMWMCLSIRKTTHGRLSHTPRCPQALLCPLLMHQLTQALVISCFTFSTLVCSKVLKFGGKGGGPQKPAAFGNDQVVERGGWANEPSPWLPDSEQESWELLTFSNSVRSVQPVREGCVTLKLHLDTTTVLVTK